MPAAHKKEPARRWFLGATGALGWCRAAPIRAVLLALVVVLVLPAPAGAQALSGDILAKITMRVLSYDKTVSKTAGKSFSLVVLHSGSAPAVFKSFQKFKGHVIQKIPVAVSSLVYQDANQLRAALRKDGVDAVMVSDSLASSVGTIAGVCRELSVRSIAPTEKMVKDGLALTVVARGGRPRIIVNLTAAKSEGMQLSAEVLGLSQVIK